MDAMGPATIFAKFSRINLVQERRKNGVGVYTNIDSPAGNDVIPKPMIGNAGTVFKSFGMARHC